MNRNAYKTLLEERLRVNSAFACAIVNQQAVGALPEDGVPSQLVECAIQMPEVDKFTATRSGPGTIRDPLDAAHEDDDAFDEISGESSNENHTEHAAEASPCSVEQPAPKTSDPQVNQFETPLGLDPTAK